MDKDIYLTGNKDLFTLDEAICEGFLKPVAALFLVSIIAGAIELPITVLNSLVYGVGGDLGIKLPGTHTDDGHLLTGWVKSYIRGSNHGSSGRVRMPQGCGVVR